MDAYTGFAYCNSEPQEVSAELEPEGESIDSDSSDITVTQSGYNKQVMDKKFNKIELINKDIGEIEENIAELKEVSESNKKLPPDERHNDENLEQYKDDYPDYFEENPRPSVEKSLNSIKNEKINEIKEKQQQVEAIVEEINNTQNADKDIDNDDDDNDKNNDIIDYSDDISDFFDDFF